MHHLVPWGVLDGVGEVVHGEDAPLGALAVVLNVADAVEHRVAHVEVAGGQVDLGPEGVLPLGELPVLHPLEEVQVLPHRPVPPGALGGGGGVPPILPELLGGELADVGQALFDQVHRQLVGPLKIVRAVEETVPPVKPQPVDVLLDGVHVLRVLLGGVGIVHTEVADAAVLLRGAEVDGQGLAVADVEVAVGLRREPGVDLFPLAAAPGLQFLLDDAVNEIGAHGLFRHGPHSLSQDFGR